MTELAFLITHYINQFPSLCDPSSSGCLLLIWPFYDYNLPVVLQFQNPIIFIESHTSLGKHHSK